MSAWETFLLQSVLIGVGATAVMDLLALAQKALLGVPPPDLRAVGRWVGHMPRGRFVHASIRAVEPVAGEAALGWAVHYATGVAFAALLLGLWGLEWATEPSLPPALIVAAMTLAAPFLVMQPALGAGFFAARTPKPWSARAKSLANHLSFGLGLYLAGEAVAALLF